MLTKEEEDIASRKPIAKVRPRQKPTVTLTPVSIPVRKRRWTDIETHRSNDQKCFEVSKAIARLLRHDQSVSRGSDGSIQYNDIIEECRKNKLDGATQWPLEDWTSTLAKGGGAKKRFLCCLNPDSSRHISYFKAIQGLSGGIATGRELQDKVLLPNWFTECIYHVGNVSEVHSKFRRGLIPGGQSLNKRGRQSEFFTIVIPVEEKHVWRKLHAT